MKQSVFKRKKTSEKWNTASKTTSGETLIYWMNFLIPMKFFYSVLVFIYQIQVQEGIGDFVPLQYLGACAFFLILYIAARKLSKLGLIIAADTVVILVVLTWDPLPGSPLLLAGVLLAYSIIQLVGRGDPDDPAKGIVKEIYFKINEAYWGIGIWILMVFNLWMNRSARNKIVAEQSAKLMLLVFAIYFAEYLFQKYSFLLYDYYSRFRQRDELDQKFRKRFLAFGGVCGAVIAAVLLAVSGLLAKPLEAMMTLLARLWNSLWQSYDPNTDSFQLPWSTQAPANGGNEKAMEVLEQAGRNSEMANQIAVPVMFLIFLIVVVIVVRYVMKLLAKGTYSPEGEEDVITFVKKEENETTTPVAVLRRIRYGNSTNEQVRRYYNRTILWKNRKKKINRLNKLTPKELSRRMAESSKDRSNLERLTSLYEEARYNDGMISKEKATRAKELYKESVK